MPQPDFDPSEGIVRPEAEDVRSGHLVFAAGGGVWIASTDAVPEDEQAVGNLGTGGTGKLMVGIGLTRYLVLQARGGIAYALSACAACDLTVIDASLGAAYHPVQGLALDPWASYAVGFRYNSHDLEDGTRTYFGLDVAQLQLGADYYPHPVFGFGPYLELDVGLGPDLAEDTSAFVVFQAGGRIAFDPFRAGAELGPQTAKR